MAGGLVCGGLVWCGFCEGGRCVVEVVEEVGGSGASPPATLFSLSSYWQHDP